MDNDPITLTLPRWQVELILNSMDWLIGYWISGTEGEQAVIDTIKAQMPAKAPQSPVQRR